MPQLVTDGLTRAQDKYVVEALRGWKGGPLSDELFTVLAGILPQSIVDVVIPRIHEGVLQVLLTRRSKNDPLWPYMLHLPGSAMRRAEYEKYGEEAICVAFERIEREIGSPFLARPTLAGIRDYLSVRGPETSRFHVGLVDPNITLPEGAEWAPVDGLKNRTHEFIIGHLPMIEQAVDYYRRRILKEPGLSEEEIQQFLDLAGRIPPGPMDARVYEAFAPRTPQIYVEVVPVRRCANGSIEVLLSRRTDPNAAFYGQRHVMGSVRRNSDTQQYPHDPRLGPLERIQNRELGAPFAWTDFVGMHFYQPNERGVGDAYVYVAEIAADTLLPANAQWVSAEKLPELPDLISVQLPMIQKAVAHYEQLNRR